MQNSIISNRIWILTAILTRRFNKLILLFFSRVFSAWNTSCWKNELIRYDGHSANAECKFWRQIAKGYFSLGLAVKIHLNVRFRKTVGQSRFSWRGIKKSHNSLRSRKIWLNSAFIFTLKRKANTVKRTSWLNVPNFTSSLYIPFFKLGILPS